MRGRQRGKYIEVCNNARNIGVIFYSHVNLDKHVMNTCKTAFYHLRNIAKIRNSVSLGMMLRRLFMHLFHLSWMSVILFYMAYPNRLLISYSMYKNCAARLVTRTRSSEHITPVLRRLHWLPVRQRITYKILLLTYKALSGIVPKYIALISFSPMLRRDSYDLLQKICF